MAEADARYTYNMHEAKTQLSRLVERAEAGEEIIIARDGKPRARLVPLPLKPGERRRPGRWKGLLGHIPDSVWFDPLPDEELALWEGGHRDRS